jgi:hypothetical protein
MSSIKNISPTATPNGGTIILMESLYLNEKAKLCPSPTLSVGRFAGELIVGFLFGLLVRLAIPEEFVECND